MLQGWSAFTAGQIQEGQFVCQYAGELLRNNQAAERLKKYDEQPCGPGHALLVSYDLLWMLYQLEIDVFGS